MPAKKNQNFLVRRRTAKKKSLTVTRAYTKKHSNVIAYLYETEDLEIEAMVKVARKIAREKR